MITVGETLADGDFRQSVTVYRQSGSWSTAGDWTLGTETALTISAVVTIATSADLDQLPEGDQQKGAIAVFATSPLILTDGTQTSDQILWHGTRWRVAQLYDRSQYGYWKAVAVKMNPATEA